MPKSGQNKVEKTEATKKTAIPKKGVKKKPVPTAKPTKSKSPISISKRAPSTSAPTQAAPTPPEPPKEAPRRGEEQIVYLNLNELHAFKNHPFQVRDDEEMRAMVSSVQDKGVTQPAIFMKDFIIRKIKYEELDVCTCLIRDSFATVARQFKLTRQNCPTNGAFIEKSRLEKDWHNGNLMYGLYKEQMLVGFMQLEQKSSDIYELEKLAVLPKYRHLNYGTALLSFAFQVAIELKTKKITIGIIEENIVLKNWYQAHGFIHTGTKTFEHLPFIVGYMEYHI